MAIRWWHSVQHLLFPRDIMHMGTVNLNSRQYARVIT